MAAGTIIKTKTKENWLALVLAIVNEHYSASKALDYFGLSEPPVRKTFNFTRKQRQRMYKLHKEEGLTYEEIAELYNCTDSAVYYRIKKIRQQKA